MGGKADVGRRLASELERLSLSQTMLAERTGVTLQAVNGWLRDGRFARKHYDTLRAAGVDLAWVLTGIGEPGKAPPDLSAEAIRFAELYDACPAGARDHLMKTARILVRDALRDAEAPPTETDAHHEPQRL